MQLENDNIRKQIVTDTNMENRSKSFNVEWEHNF